MPLELPAHHRATGLVDVLDRVLDKGLVIAGDIKVSLAEVELLTIRIRLLVCSLDKAQEIGLDWWRYDRDLSPGRQRRGQLLDEQRVPVRALDHAGDELGRRRLGQRGGAAGAAEPDGGGVHGGSWAWSARSGSAGATTGGTATALALEPPERVAGLLVSGTGTSEPSFADPWVLDIFAEWKAAEETRDPQRWLDAFMRFVPGPFRLLENVDPEVVERELELGSGCLTEESEAAEDAAVAVGGGDGGG